MSGGGSVVVQDNDAGRKQRLVTERGKFVVVEASSASPLLLLKRCFE